MTFCPILFTKYYNFILEILYLKKKKLKQGVQNAIVGKEECTVQSRFAKNKSFFNLIMVSSAMSFCALDGR